MNIPNLPTDNLYKFIAIFGLLIIFLSFYLQNISFEDLQGAKSDFELSITSNANRLKILDMQLELLQGQMENTDALINRISVESDSVLNYVLAQREISDTQNKALQDWIKQTEIESEMVSQLMDRENKKYLGLQTKLNQIDSINLKFELLKDAMNIKRKRYSDLSDNLMFLGTTLMISGFAFWYFKYQRYTDAETRWKGQTFIELLKDEDTKKKAIQEELKKTKNQENPT